MGRDTVPTSIDWIASRYIICGMDRGQRITVEVYGPATMTALQIADALDNAAALKVKGMKAPVKGATAEIICATRLVEFTRLCDHKARFARYYRVNAFHPAVVSHAKAPRKWWKFWG